MRAPSFSSKVPPPAPSCASLRTDGSSQHHRARPPSCQPRPRPRPSSLSPTVLDRNEAVASFMRANTEKRADGMVRRVAAPVNAEMIIGRPTASVGAEQSTGRKARRGEALFTLTHTPSTAPTYPSLALSQSGMAQPTRRRGSGWACVQPAGPTGVRDARAPALALALALAPVPVPAHSVGQLAARVERTGRVSPPCWTQGSAIGEDYKAHLYTAGVGTRASPHPWRSMYGLQPPRRRGVCPLYFPSPSPIFPNTTLVIAAAAAGRAGK